MSEHLLTEDATLILDEHLEAKYQDIKQVLLDYIHNGAPFEHTLTLLQECGCEYKQAVQLLADIELWVQEKKSE